MYLLVTKTKKHDLKFDQNITRTITFCTKAKTIITNTKIMSLTKTTLVLICVEDY